MPKYKINKEKLANALDKALANRSLREAAKEIGVSKDAISRVLNQKEINVNNFTLIFKYIEKKFFWFTIEYLLEIE